MPELAAAITDLYRVFARYPLAAVVEGCPCCVRSGDQERLHVAPLRELTEEDLSRFAFKAMTTWGTTDDFKHFLPRIFELMATTDFIVDSSAVLGKLPYGNWDEWPADEQEAIRNFLPAWWTHETARKTYFDADTFTAICDLLDDSEPLLRDWSLRYTDNSYRSFADLVFLYYNEIADRKGSFRSFPEPAAKQLLQHIHAFKPLLEEAFFHYETEDPQLAEQLSQALYILETAEIR